VTISQHLAKLWAILQWLVFLLADSVVISGIDKRDSYTLHP